MEQKNVWEEVLARTDIVSVISETVTLSKQGKNFRACCPFHGEKTPSFMVSPEKGIFKCFGCGKSGNALKFLEYSKNISSLEALKMLATKANINIDDYLTKHTQATAKSQEELTLIDITKEANDFFQYQMVKNKETPELKKFLESRHLDNKLIKEFEIGFAPENISIYSHLKNKFNDFAISNASLVSSISFEKNFFNNRITFPIKNEYGDVVAFSARDITNKLDNKYLNSAETPIFKKSEVLFNYYHAKPFISSTKEVYLVEGQFDCIALYKANFPNAVASMGTSLSKNHLALLRGTKINLFFDSDAAGKAATEKNLKIILMLSLDFSLEVNFLKNTFNKDADELYNLDDGQTLKTILKRPQDLGEYLYDTFIEPYKNTALNAQKRYEIYSKLFEYLYYLPKPMQLLFKSRLINENILDKETYESFESSFLKPNFPSDPNLARIKITSSKTKNSSEIPKSFTNYYENSLSFNDLNFPKQIKPKAKKSINFGRSGDFAIILKAILMHPDYIKRWPKETYATLHAEELQQTKKSLICYIISKNDKMKDKFLLPELIKNDENLSLETKDEYLNILLEIQNLNSSTSEEEFDSKIKALNQSEPKLKQILGIKRLKNE
ncbi:DNA primase [Metamycoplasma arthritidis]|uniref:DNA primase n=1 Tax=Metamycoplasma arthritidis (strain 158L3-1) TaxID=243272 RepID=B3PMH5_META1|nr:DNA primase [Metamycoplasma arthritidis]ACF07227.1 DNA primase [Metamycoplasma arthritidis 158L3-1]VEU78751.1 DNA primase [Metamycoplasma arthritidis]